MKNLPVRDMYNGMVDESVEWINSNSQESLSGVNTFLEEVEETLKQYVEGMRSMKNKAVDTVYNATYIDYLANKISQVRNVNIAPYVASFDIPEEYTNAIYGARDEINTQLNNFIEGSEIKYVKSGMNEVYQQGMWAYNYWQLEENIRKNAKQVLELIKEIIEDELKEYTHNLNLMSRNP